MVHFGETSRWSDKLFRKERWDHAHPLLSMCSGVLSSTGDIVEWKKGRLEEHLNPVDMPFLPKAAPKISGALVSISVAEVRNLLTSKAVGVHEFWQG